MGVEDHRNKAPKSVHFSVITVSDTRTEVDDISGKIITDLMIKAGHVLTTKAIVRDDVSDIQRALRESLEDGNTQVVIVTGGTGVSRRDLTLEAVSHFQEKSLPGFGELFRALSFKDIGAAAIMSRATAFVTEGKAVFCLPGSERAVRLAVEELIAPEVGHLVWEANR